jgi:hypothetical protein
MSKRKRFPKPWRSRFCGDCYRVYDADDQELFIIVGDEFSNGDEEKNPDLGTVFEWGSKEDHAALCEEIEKVFPEVT